jgi:phage baseplate assembly protein V
MGMLDQVNLLLRPLRTRVANMVARAVVQLVDDDVKLQLLQLGVLEGENIDKAEHVSLYGISSVPLVGAEAVVLFPNGDRAHPLVIAVSDRRHRPTGGDPGQVTVYNHTGAKIIMQADGDIEVQPAPGREVFIRSDGGTAERLVKKSEFDGHTHLPGSLTAPSGGGTVTGVSGGAAAVTGTQRLRAE